jgi:hypothetical protein
MLYIYSETEFKKRQAQKYIHAHNMSLPVTLSLKYPVACSHCGILMSSFPDE